MIIDTVVLLIAADVMIFANIANIKRVLKHNDLRMKMAISWDSTCFKIQFDNDTELDYVCCYNKQTIYDKIIVDFI